MSKRGIKKTPGDKTSGKPQGPVKADERIIRRVVSVSFDSETFQRESNAWRLTGFREGVEYIVTLAEDFLVKHKKLSSREALAKDSKLVPAWWIATLVTALHHDPPYAPITPKKVKQGPEPDEPEKEADE